MQYEYCCVICEMIEPLPVEMCGPVVSPQILCSPVLYILSPMGTDHLMLYLRDRWTDRQTDGSTNTRTTIGHRTRIVLVLYVLVYLYYNRIYAVIVPSTSTSEQYKHSTSTVPVQVGIESVHRHKHTGCACARLFFQKVSSAVYLR